MIFKNPAMPGICPKPAPNPASRPIVLRADAGCSVSSYPRWRYFFYKTYNIVKFHIFIVHMTPTMPSQLTQPTTSQRLYSLDALRGFDMFWIMGGEEIFHTMAKAAPTPFWQALSDQLEHPDWNGFHFYDLIFPLFLFMAGVSTPFFVCRALAKSKTRGQLVLRVVKRGLILVLFGLIANNGLEIRHLADIRFPSVLGRIGIAYMC